MMADTPRIFVEIIAFAAARRVILAVTAGRRHYAAPVYRHEFIWLRRMPPSPFRSRRRADALAAHG